MQQRKSDRRNNISSCLHTCLTDCHRPLDASKKLQDLPWLPDKIQWVNWFLTKHI
jgi:hypothetical protein